MRIGVDAHVLAGKFQGTRTYLYYLYKTLCFLNCGHEFVFFGHWNGQHPFGKNVEHVNYLSISRVKRLTYQTSPLINKYGIDLLHVNYNAPLFLPCKSIVTLHDILWETHSRFFKKRQILRNRILSRLSSLRATQIHTVSEYTRSAIIQKYNIPDNRIHVVPNGVDLKSYHDKNKNKSIKKILSKYGIRDYFLTVGRLEPRKNHIGLLKAYNSLLKRKVSLPNLVVIGQRDFSEQGIFKFVEQQNLKNKILFFDHIENSELPDFYRAAKLFIYPSFAEGFGLPPLEAMACGLPIVTSDTTSIPEVTNNAALLVDPNNINQLADTLVLINRDERLRDKMSQMAIKRSKIWTWENAAKKYLEAVKQIS